VTVRIGVLSTAHLHAEAYVEILDRMDGVELVGVTDGEEARGREFAEEHGTSYREPSALLERIDGAVVCSTNAEHGRWIRAAADAGVAALSEKPLATTVDEAASVANYCADRDVPLGVAMPLRHSQPARRADELLSEGAIGDLRAISGTNRGQMPGGWFVDPDQSGGGAAMDHTVHIVDLIHWLTGERVREVYAETSTRFHDVPVEDVNVLSMELSDGTIFSLDGSWSKPEEWHFWGDATVDLTGTEGTISVDCFAETFAETVDEGPETGIESVFWGDDPNERMLRRFVETVRDDRPPATPAEDGVDAVSVVDAVYESAERSEPVVVDY